MIFTIFLAERVYNIFTLLSFYKYLFTLIQVSYTMFPRSLFILFTMYIHRGKWGSGFTFIYSLQFLILFLSLTACNWDYLYY